MLCICNVIVPINKSIYVLYDELSGNMLQEVGKTMRKSCRHFCLLFCMNCSWQSVKLVVPEKLATYLVWGMGEEEEKGWSCS